MRYRNNVERVLVVDDSEFNIQCTNELEVGSYCIENGTSLELAQINGSPYGWFINGFPILKKENDHAVFIAEYDRLFELLETSSFWQGQIREPI